MVFGWAMQGGRGLFSEGRKGKNPFHTLKTLIISAFCFLVLNFLRKVKKQPDFLLVCVFYRVLSESDYLDCSDSLCSKKKTTATFTERNVAVVERDILQG